ncbi:hypothetical protein E2C01_089690 [Portunus trituberculatus]|uniref:Uncharacterized protein n=1 Tax=Portunus trituberculatus TaxID=210409 RepID=A0A5B7JN48_PORTR|nr:hypothetical protein [Portunus trituberculatus]
MVWHCNDRARNPTQSVPRDILKKTKSEDHPLPPGYRAELGVGWDTIDHTPITPTATHARPS